MKRQFKIISTEKLFETPRFTLNIKRAETDGKTKTFCQLVKPLVAFTIPLSPTNRTVILRQYRYSAEKEMWEFPAGHVDPGESSELAAVRELKEETSLKADRVEKIGAFSGMPSATKSSYDVYFAPVTDEQLDAIVTPEDEDEITEVKVITLDEMSKMISKGQLESGTTLSAYAILLNYLSVRA